MTPADVQMQDVSAAGGLARERADITTEVARPRFNRLSRTDLVAGMLVTAVLAITWLPRLKGPIDLRWDGAAYYILGTSLFEGRGYRYLNEPGDVQAVVWPPALPAIVAAHEAALGTADVDVVAPVLRVSFFAIWAAYVALAFFALRSIGSRWFAVAGTLLTGLHMSTIWLSDRLYADLPFALAVTAFLVVAWRWPRRGLAAWAIATIAFLLRTAGVALFMAWIADAVLSRQWRRAARRLAVALLPVLAWQMYIHRVEQSAPYIHPPYAYARADYLAYNVSYSRTMLLRDPDRPELGRAGLTELPRRVLANLPTSVRHLGEAVSLLEKDWVTLVASVKEHRVAGRLVSWRLIPLSLLTFGIFVVAGGVMYACTGYRLISLVLASYVLLLALLPIDYHWPRYLAGVAPLVAACFLVSVGAAARVAGRVRRVGRVLSIVPIGVLAGALVLQAITAAWYFRYDLQPVSHSFGGPQHTYRMFTYDASFAAFDRGLDWVRERVHPGDVVVSSMPHWAYLRTGAAAVMPPFERRTEVAFELLKSVHPRFAVIDSSGFSAMKIYALPVMAGAPSMYSLEWRDGDDVTEVFSAREDSRGKCP